MCIRSSYIFNHLSFSQKSNASLADVEVCFVLFFIEAHANSERRRQAKKRTNTAKSECREVSWTPAQTTVLESLVRGQIHVFLIVHVGRVLLQGFR